MELLLFLLIIIANPLTANGNSLIRTFNSLIVRFANDEIMISSPSTYLSTTFQFWNMTDGSFIKMLASSRAPFAYYTAVSNGYLYSGGSHCAGNSFTMERFDLSAVNGSSGQLLMGPHGGGHSIFIDKINNVIYHHFLNSPINIRHINGTYLDSYSPGQNGHVLAMFPVDDVLAAVSFDRFEIILYNRTTKSQIYSIPTFDLNHQSYAILSGTKIFIYGIGGDVHEWDIRTWSFVRDYPFTVSSGWCASAHVGLQAFYVERQYLYLISGNVVSKFDTNQSGLLIVTFTAPVNVFSVYATENHVFAGSISASNTIYQWRNVDCPLGTVYNSTISTCSTPFSKTPNNLMRTIPSLAIRYLDNNVLFTSSSSFYGHLVYMWNASTAQLIRIVRFPIRFPSLMVDNGTLGAGGGTCSQGQDNLFTVDLTNPKSTPVKIISSKVAFFFLSDGMIFAHTNNQNISRYDFNGTENFQYAGAGNTHAVAFARDNQFFYTVIHVTREIRRYNLTSYFPDKIVASGHSGNIIDMHKEGSKIFTLAANGQIMEWLLPDIIYIRQYKSDITTWCAHVNIGRKVFAVERNFLYLSKGSTVLKYDTDNGTIVQTFIASSPVQSVAASESFVFASSTAENRIYQWYNFDCPPGFGLTDDKRSCSPCSPGFFKSSNEYEPCNTCPAGFISSNSSSLKCTGCPAGMQSSQNRTQCIECPAGSYRSSVELDKCIDCPAGGICNSTTFACQPGFQLHSNNTHCTQCSLGYYKLSPGNETCLPCPIGQESMQNRTGCSTCLLDQFRPSTDTLACIDCPSGARCTPTNMTCLRGFTPSKNKTLTCDNCQDGYYKSTEGNYQCDACATGLYSSDDYGECLACPSGYFKSDTGECKRCGAGREPVYNRTACVTCPLGTYKPTDTLNNCIKCPNGASCTPLEFMCNPAFEINSFLNGCRRCLTGWYKSESGNQGCSQCPLGTQSHPNGNSCIECPTDTYRPSFDYNVCIKCPVGAKCTLTSFSCLPGWKMTKNEVCDLGSSDETIIFVSTIQTVTATSNLSVNNLALGMSEMQLIIVLVIPVFIIGVLSWCLLRFAWLKLKQYNGQFGLKNKNTVMNELNISQVNFHENDTDIETAATMEYAQDV